MSDLRGSAAPAQITFGSSGKILAAIVVLVAAGAVGGYVYRTMPPQQKQVVAVDRLPTTDIPAAAPVNQHPLPTTPAH